MELLTRSASVRDRVKAWKDDGQRVALVPTAGFLHKGHLRLIAEAQERADRVIVSIVARGESHSATADGEFVQNIAPDVLFVPPAQELYPFGREFAACVSVPAMARALQSIVAPDTMSEVITIIAKLLHVIAPHCVLFGERHFVEAVMVRRMVDDLFMPIEIIECPAFRDTDGLAPASANRELAADERVVATQLYGTLSRMAARLDDGERDFAALIQNAAAILKSAGFGLHYLHILDAHDLEAARPSSRDLVILVAAALHGAELRDALRVHLIERH